jgi:hypothetical protein
MKIYKIAILGLHNVAALAQKSRVTYLLIIFFIFIVKQCTFTGFYMEQDVFIAIIQQI